MRIAGAEAAGTRSTVVLLPGAQQKLDEFRQAGFDQALWQRRLPLDVILAAPMLSHLTDRRWIEALRCELIEPLRARSGPLWLGGISLGAFMALRFAAEHPGLIDGLCLIAPYLGSRIVAAEIARCASLQHWSAQAPDADDDERRVWSYVRELRPPPPLLFLGISRADRFADTQRLLAQALPASSRSEIDGRHEWPVWRHLWDNFLDRHAQGAYPAGCPLP